MIALDLREVKPAPVHLKPTVVFSPTSQEFTQQVAITKNHVLLTTLEHVQGRALRLHARGKDGKWTRLKLPVPDNPDDRDFCHEFAGRQSSSWRRQGFLTPSGVMLGDAADGFAQACQDSEGAI